MSQAFNPLDATSLLTAFGAVGAATLFRFSDGVWLAAPLLAACGAVPAWRRRAPALAIAGGLAAGGAQWIAEAYARWGGIGARLHASSATEGGMGLHWAGHDAKPVVISRPRAATT
ncbi:hypothetical protein [Microbispora sp. NBRC 16548]|uniref:hypothetical protein n=1 Tax=Microbispora sp. NBRC 16548 TaxID=3030994 RepID=UPI0024A50774|nr:hypothetical protein [Microbispora sp. NBRC 16548]GLX09046.1 hypothetical protein Misp03_59720 [Microbispora sp. NBRC 16548]